MRYADGHKGIVLRIVPNVAKDSKFQKFVPVVYRGSCPPLFKGAVGFLEDVMFGDRDARCKASMDQIAYSKTREWALEDEFRLVIWLGHGEKDWNELAYHSDEIAEIYLGAEMDDDTREDLLKLACGVNPAIAVFQMLRDGSGRLLAKAIE